jgi:pimeloyl-ACP methyl ester carboxylesterase
MDGREWRRQIDGLSGEFAMVAWDAQGAGRSSDPPETLRLSDWADCLAAFIEALGLGRSHVGGLSWGGGLAMEFYRRHPGGVRTLVLASAYAGWAGSLSADVVDQRRRTCAHHGMYGRRFMRGSVDRSSCSSRVGA